MAIRSEYETLFDEWRQITEAYDRHVHEMPLSTLQSEITLAWLLYKTSEADLIRRHGWTVLEFETETRRVNLQRSEVQEQHEEVPRSSRGETW